MTDLREITGYSIKDEQGVEKQFGFVNLRDAQLQIIPCDDVAPDVVAISEENQVKARSGL